MLRQTVKFPAEVFNQTTLTHPSVSAMVSVTRPKHHICGGKLVL